MKLLTISKSSLFLFVVILSVLCVSLIFDRSCTSRKLDIARGKYENQKIVTVMSQLKADEEKAELYSKLSKHVLKIEYLEKEVEKKGLEDVEREREIERLEDEEVVLVDKDMIIINLRFQIREWTERFTLAAGIIEDQKQIIFSLREKYDIQVGITNAWISKFNTEKALRLSAENVIKESTKEIRRLRAKAKLKTGGITIVGAILLYAVLK